LLKLPGFAFLRELAWPVDSAILDGEAVAGDGHEGIQSVFEARSTAGSAMAVVLFDVLHLSGQDVMREPWRDRRNPRCATRVCRRRGAHHSGGGFAQQLSGPPLRAWLEDVVRGGALPDVAIGRPRSIIRSADPPAAGAIAGS